MDKILTVVVPVYNMEKYLAKCLESILVEQIVDRLEIIIINDGSKDSSLSIINDYYRKYPESIVVVDKVNGNYGSCLNYGFGIAKGKYIRTLDADDTFNSSELVRFVDKLTLLTEDVDLILTNYLVEKERYKKKILCRQGGVFEKCYTKIINFRENGIIYNIHTATYRTLILKDNCIKLSEGISYTDIELLLYSLINIKRFVLYDIYLYCYSIGREEQSVSMVSYLKNIDHIYTILYRCFRRFDSVFSKSNNLYINQINVVLPLVEVLSYLEIVEKRIKRDTANRFTEFLDLLTKCDSSLMNTLLHFEYFKLPYFAFWYNKRQYPQTSIWAPYYYLILMMRKMKSLLYL